MKKITLLSLLLVSSIVCLSQTIDTDYDKQKKSIIKMEFFSPLTNHTTFGYESYIKDWVSWEAKVGVIGLGTDSQDTNPGGFILRGGPKFKLNPDFATRDLRGSHLLGGKYIRPEIVMSVYSEDEVEFTLTGDIRTRKSFSAFAFLINYGRQYILANIMSVDWHIGVGYGFDNAEFGKYHYSHSNGDGDLPVAVSAGFTIGVLLK